MPKQEKVRRYGPEQWVTMRDTGEHVKIECWSPLVNAYRVRSRKSGLQLLTESQLTVVREHPEVRLGRHWSRCHAPGCGAPLTPELPECPRCRGLVCSCGRCQCARTSAKK